jgi:hypothetical protein
MDTKLNADEIRALQSLEKDFSPHVGMYRDGDLPQRLFAFNLVARQPSGTTVLTKMGERALFRHACVAALLSIENAAPAEMTPDVQRWLLSSGFIEKDADGGPACAITRRGRLWLAASDDEPIQATPVPTAEDFERRRA